MLVRYLFIFALILSQIFGEISEPDAGIYQKPSDDIIFSYGVKEDKFPKKLIDLAGSSTFKEWVNYEDEFIKFSYPKHPDIKLEIQDKESIPVQGGRVSTVDTSFNRAYRLVSHGQTMNVIMLDHAEWLDDGICWCGAIVYQKLLVNKGQLYRFSYLKSGVMKKAQVLADKTRAMTLEWTHGLIHPKVFSKMARSIELKNKSDFTEEEMKAKARRLYLDKNNLSEDVYLAGTYGYKSIVSWFNFTTTKEDAIQSLGKPNQEKEDGSIVWETELEEYEYRRTQTLTLRFQNGELLPLNSKYLQDGEEVAVEGTVSWMWEAVKPFRDGEAGFGDENEETKKALTMSKDLKEQLLSLFFEKSKDPKSNFNTLCQILEILLKHGVRSEDALDVVREKFVKYSYHSASHILYDYGNKEDLKIFVEKIKQIYAGTIVREPRSFVRDDEFYVGDLSNYLHFISDDHPEYVSLVRQGLEHKEAVVNEKLFYHLDTVNFSKDERSKFIHKGLASESYRVRSATVDCFHKSEVLKKDWKALKEVYKEEPDEELKQEMKKALEERKK